MLHRWFCCWTKESDPLTRYSCIPWTILPPWHWSLLHWRHISGKETRYSCSGLSFFLVSNPIHTCISYLGCPSFVLYSCCCRACGREPLYVDLEADPRIDKDTPPDLKSIADAAAPIEVEGHAEAVAPAAPSAAAGKKKKFGDKAASTGTHVAARAPDDDVRGATSALIDVVLRHMVGEEGHTAMSADALRQMNADVAVRLNMLKNAAYARGFKAARGAAVAAVLTAQD
jgi:hypothetical protein